MNKKGYRVALFCEEIRTHRANDIIGKIRKKLYENDCLLNLCVTESKAELEQAYCKNCIEQKMDAVIVMHCSNDEFILEQFKNVDITVLFLCETKIGNSVVIDEKSAAIVLGEYLMKHEHLMIRYMGSDWRLANTRIEGIKEAYRKMKQPHDFAVKISDGSYLDTFEKMKEAFAEQLDLLILEDDMFAIPFAKYVLEYHIAVPQNVSVVTFGGSDLTRIMSPVITCVVYDYDVYADDVVSSLIALMEHKEMPARHSMFYIQEGDSIR